MNFEYFELDDWKFSKFKAKMHLFREKKEKISTKKNQIKSPA